MLGSASAIDVKVDALAAVGISEFLHIPIRAEPAAASARRLRSQASYDRNAIVDG
jgi:hypothetical protein